ncbi:MAG: hypothetical protein J5511_00920 [Bacilli bacterium]|nr:hypothetical protein [Bacilli bacterium]
MKKGTKLFTTVLAVCTSLAGLIGAAKLSHHLLTSANYHPESLDCSYYFNSNNGFTSIAKINKDLFDSNIKDSYKTWGTITESWTYNNKTSTYVQSTDQNGDVAAICLYDCNTPVGTYPIGSVIEFTFSGSNLVNYNNLPEITSLASISLAYNINPYPVETFDGSYLWSDGNDSSSQYFETAKYMGPVRLRLEEVTMGTLNTNKKDATINTSGSDQVPAYYANIGASGETSSLIYDRLYKFRNSSTFTVYGYLNAYQTTTKSSLQFLFRNQFDIVPSTFTSDGDVIQSVAMPPETKTSYEVGDSIIVSNPILTMRNGNTHYVLETSYSNYDLSTAGEYNVSVLFSYENHSGIEETSFTLTNLLTITVSAAAPELSYIEVINAVAEYNVGDSFVTPTVYVYYTDGSHKDISDDALYEGYDLSTAGTQTVEVTYFEGDFVDYTTYTITVTENSGTLNTLTFNSAITSGSYSTGNYGSKSSNGISFVYYRTTSLSSGVANLLPATCDYGDPFGGAISNTTPIKGIKSVTIKYSNTSKTGATAGKLSYGATNTLDGSVAIPYSISENTVTLNLTGTINFIKIESGNTKLALNEFTVNYTNSGSASYTQVSAYTNNYRINPTQYTGTLVAGSTSVTVPVSVSYSGNTYTVLQTKTYTYYTTDYVANHPEVKDDAAMIDAADVANYWTIFGEAPANYALKGSTSQVNSIFGSDARCVQEFNGVDYPNGYARSLPDVIDTTYYELDLNVDGNYSTSSRGVGRIVGWKYGFNNSAYGNGSYRVCHFTDDHYATFQEFNNLGQFLSKFDAQQKCTGKKWSAPNTAYAA